jgi:hypothetical protein
MQAIFEKKLDIDMTLEFNRAVKSPLLIRDDIITSKMAFDSPDGFNSPPLAATMITVSCDTPLLAAG